MGGQQDQQSWLLCELCDIVMGLVQPPGSPKGRPRVTPAGIVSLLLGASMVNKSVNFIYYSSQDWKSKLKIPPPDTRYKIKILFSEHAQKLTTQINRRMAAADG